MLLVEFLANIKIINVLNLSRNTNIDMSPLRNIRINTLFIQDMINIKGLEKLNIPYICKRYSEGYLEQYTKIDITMPVRWSLALHTRHIFSK